MNDKEIDEVIEIIAETIERPGSPKSKAREIVHGILIPTLTEAALDFHILERTLNLPRQ
jgi:hypothetical protein